MVKLLSADSTSNPSPYNPEADTLRALNNRSVLLIRQLSSILVPYGQHPHSLFHLPVFTSVIVVITYLHHTLKYESTSTPLIPLLPPSVPKSTKRYRLWFHVPDWYLIERPRALGCSPLQRPGRAGPQWIMLRPPDSRATQPTAKTIYLPSLATLCQKKPSCQSLLACPSIVLVRGYTTIHFSSSSGICLL